MTEFSHELTTNVKPLANRQLLAKSYHLPMDVIEIRHRNLIALIEGLTARGIVKVKDQAATLGMSSSYFGQLRGGEKLKPKKMGDDVARKLELVLRKPHGWMDQPQGSSESSAGPASQSMRLDPAMLAETHRTLRRLEGVDPRDKEYHLMEDIAKVARFVQLYEMRAAMSGQPSSEEWFEYGRKTEALTSPQGAKKHGRDDSVPTHGAGTETVARRVRNKT